MAPSNTGTARKGTALILASGVGSRLASHTKAIPKALVPVNGRAVLDRQLDSLAACGVDEVVITTGHMGRAIEDHVRARCPATRVRFAFNDRYAETNYIYSMHLAGSLNGDFLVLAHGDLLFETDLLRDVLAAPVADAMVTCPLAPRLGKDFMARVDNGMVREIGVDVDGPMAVPCQPLYKLSKAFYREWARRIREYVDTGRTGCYAEDALNELLPDLSLAAYEYGGKLCMEVDTPEDLELAESLFA